MGFLKDNDIKAIVCDIDGTFYPKSEMYRRLISSSILHPVFAIKYNRMRQRVREEDGYSSLPPVSHRDYAKRACNIMYGKDDEKTVDAFLDKEKRVFHDKWERSYRNLRSYPYVKETLQRAKDDGLTLGVLSDFPLGVKLEAMGLEGLFDVELSSEDFGRFKPNGTPFDILSSRIAFPRSNILYIGDSERKDIEGGKRAGMRTALISREREKSAADIVASSWHELNLELF